MALLFCAALLQSEVRH